MKSFSISESFAENNRKHQSEKVFSKKKLKSKSLIKLWKLFGIKFL